MNKLAVLLMGLLSVPALAQIPQGNPVVLLVEENHSYESVIGNPGMPFLNDLAKKYSLATEYYADTHPSIGNYFMLTTGRIITNDDSFDRVLQGDNLVRQFIATKKSWKAYAQSLLKPGYVGPNRGPYLKRHNPFAYLPDVVNDPAQRQNLVPFSQLAEDLKADRLPNFIYIVPDAQNDAHDCPPGKYFCRDQDKLIAADEWLASNLPPLLESPAFKRNGLLIVVFDESYASDKRHGGGRIPVVLAGPRVKHAYRSTKFYQHASTLRLICDSLGLGHCPGAGADSLPMDELFQTGAAEKY